MSSYRDEMPAKEGLGRFSGVYITPPGVQTMIYPLGGTKGRTVFRAIPEIENGQEQPFRLSAEPFHYSGWIRAENAVRVIGVNEKFTCLTRVKGKDRNFRGPIDRFVYGMHKIFKDVVSGGDAPPIPRDWLKWKEKQGALPKVETCGFLQGMLYENAGKQFKSQDGKWQPQKPVLLMITKSAREAIETACNKEVDDYKGDMNDYASRFACGDFISLAKGKALSFSFIPASGTSFPHYTVSTTGNPIPVPLDSAMKMWTPWDKLLRFLSAEEQVNLLVQHFPPEAIDLVLGHGEYADMLPANVRNSWTNRNKVVSSPSTFSLPKATVINNAGIGTTTHTNTIMPPDDVPFDVGDVVTGNAVGFDADFGSDADFGTDDPSVSVPAETIQAPTETPEALNVDARAEVALQRLQAARKKAAATQRQ